LETFWGKEIAAIFFRSEHKAWRPEGERKRERERERVGLTRQGVVLTDLQSLLDCQSINLSLSLSLSREREREIQACRL
jgi:hypothetical protein